MAELGYPESVARHRGLFTFVVSWGDRKLVLDRDSRRRLVHAGYRLGAQRAEALGREMRAIDVEYAIAFLCKWPLKPEAGPRISEALSGVREEIVAVASEGRRVDIPEGLLTPSLDLLYDNLHADEPPLAAL
jgi:hypothetical protein